MIYISKNDLSLDNLKSLVNEEVTLVSSMLFMQKKLASSILIYLKNYSKNIDTIADNVDIKLDSHISIFGETSIILNKCKFNISEYNKLMNEINVLKEKSFLTKKQENNISYDDLVQNIVNEISKYNKNWEKLQNLTADTTNDIQEFLSSNKELEDVDLKIIETFKIDEEKEKNIRQIVNKTKEKIVSIAQNNNLNQNQKDSLEKAENFDNMIFENFDSFNETKNEVKDIKLSKEENKLRIKNIVQNHSLKENTLLISELEKIVILPYKTETLYETLHYNPEKYEDIYDIIEKEYTKDINYYKNAPFTRFKEAYKLAKKSKLGLLKRVELANECMFNLSLHPAIISSCGSIDELDVYLSCLEYDELEDFNFFEIEYKIPPVLNNDNLNYFNF